MSETLKFITTTDRQEVGPETRKLIRSHVMRGKNRVKPRRKAQAHPRGPAPDAYAVIANGPPAPAIISRLFSSQFSAIPFADAVDPTLLVDVWACEWSISAILLSVHINAILSVVHSRFSKAMFRPDQCIVPSMTGLDLSWFDPMLSDAAYLNALCFTVPTYFDGLSGRVRSLESQRRDWMHYAKTVKLLQERLSQDDDSLRLQDSTIMTVLILSGHAYTLGDYESADIHINALLKLVNMRGIGTFLHNTKLLIELVRYVSICE